MRRGCIDLGILIILLSLIIYLVKNKNEIFNFFDSKIKNKKVCIKIIYFLICIIIILLLILLAKAVINLTYLGKTYNDSNEMFEECDNKIEIEKKRVNELLEEKYEHSNYQNPYIPEGFSYLEGEWNSGYVIIDNNGNEYVWVPCSNTVSKDVVKLKRNNISAVPLINYLCCYNEEYENFIKSALENGGFYISRYEIGKEQDKLVSKKGVPILTNLTREEAKKRVAEMYENVNCELINGYAYDTTLDWIMSTSNNRLNGDITKIEENIITGRYINNNIYDFCDNILEFSLENLYETIVIRGFFDSKNTSYTSNIASKENRYCVRSEDTTFGLEFPIAIRTILYK